MHSTRCFLRFQHSRHAFYSALTTLAALAGHAAPAHAQSDIGQFGVPRLPEQLEASAPATPQALARMTYGGSAKLMYMDNIYRSNTNEESDLVTIVAPGIALRTDMERHEASARLRVEGGAYMDNGENSYVDVQGDAQGSYAITDTLSLIGDMDVRRDHVPIGAFVDNPDRIADEPTVYVKTEGNVGLKADNGVYHGMVVTGLNYLDYDNAEARGGGVIINDDRDRIEWNSRARAGAYVAPQWLAYVQGTLNRRHYRTQIDSTALFEKDSDGYGLAAGMAHGEETAPTRYDIQAGYIQQDYDNPALRDIGTLGMEATGRWQVSEVLALRLDGVRSIEENTLFGASGHVMTRARAGLEYDFAPQWELDTDLRYTHNDFEFNPANGVGGRTDDIWDTSVLVEYNIAGNYYAGVEYIHVNRDSTDDSAEYTTNAALVHLSLKY